MFLFRFFVWFASFVPRSFCRLVRHIFVGAVFYYVSRLAIQYPAYRIERGYADGFGLAGFQYRHVGLRYVHPFRKFVERHLAFGHHDVYVDYDCHNVRSFDLLLCILQCLMWGQIVSFCSSLMEVPIANTSAMTNISMPTIISLKLNGKEVLIWYALPSK